MFTRQQSPRVSITLPAIWRVIILAIVVTVFAQPGLSCGFSFAMNQWSDGTYVYASATVTGDGAVVRATADLVSAGGVHAFTGDTGEMGYSATAYATVAIDTSGYYVGDTSFYGAYDPPTSFLGSDQRSTLIIGTAEVPPSLVGDITGYTYNGDGTYTLSFQAATWPVVAGVCVAQPELCVIAAVGASIAVFGPQLAASLGAILSNKTARDMAPAQAQSLSPYAAGQDQNGNCGPLPPGRKLKWRGSDDSHWHYIDWNLNPQNCTWYPIFRTGPDPGPTFIEIPR